MANLFIGILIGIVVATFSIKYLLPYFDVLFEKFTYRESIECTNFKLTAESLVKEFEKEYGDGQEIQAIGFQVPDIVETTDEDDCEDKKIGF